MHGTGVLAALLIASSLAVAYGATCEEMFGPKPKGWQKKEKTTIVFVADDGTYSGTDEALYIKANLKNTTSWDTFALSCYGGAVSGMLMGQKVMVITSGIGPMQAQSCVQFVMLTCPDFYRETLYVGTSGWPSTVGGVLNPPESCTETNKYSGKGETIRIGDLCIPQFSVNWDCRSADWDQQAGGFPNVCSAPSYNLGPTADFLYGKCLYTSPPNDSIDLAKELAKAARSKSMKKSMPPRLNRVKPYETAYWDLMRNGTGVDYYVYDSEDTTVNVFDYTQCAEIDSQFFWSGVPWEWESRSFVATTLTTGMGKLGSDKVYLARDVVYANAMEGIGFSQAMEDYTRINPTKIVPYTMMRAASNWSHKPLKLLSEGMWGYGPLEPDHVNGYAQAIQSFSNAFLTMLKRRCKRMDIPAAMCEFEVIYTGPQS